MQKFHKKLDRCALIAALGKEATSAVQQIPSLQLIIFDAPGTLLFHLPSVSFLTS